MFSAEHLRQLLAFDPLVWLAQAGEQALEMFEISLPARAHGALVFAGMRPLAIDAMALDQALQLCNRGTVETQQALLVGGIGMFQRELVRQVDHEARVAAGCAIADALGIDQ